LAEILRKTQADGNSLSPLFRWPGGKRWLTTELRKLVPADTNRYFEPFIGAGALFFALRPAQSTIADKNHALIECYEAIRDECEEVAELLQSMPRDRESYYRIRAETPTSRSARAARFVYLTTLAFNGIYRVNRAGQFNVPYGAREYGELGDLVRLRAYSEALSGSTLLTADFEESVDSARSKDLVYLDPPYTVAHANNGFIKYNDRLFSWDDQLRLARVVEDLHQRGCYLVVTNAHHESIASLYPSLRSRVVSRRSVMAASSLHRKPVDEYVFTNVG